MSRRCVAASILMLAILLPASATHIDDLKIGQTVEDSTIDLGAYKVRLPPGSPWTHIARISEVTVDMGGVLSPRLLSEIVVARIQNDRVHSMIRLRSFPRSVPMSQWPNEPCKVNRDSFLLVDELGSRIFMPECLLVRKRITADRLGREGVFAQVHDYLDSRSVRFPATFMWGLYAKYKPTNFLWAQVYIGLDVNAQAVRPRMLAFQDYMSAAVPVVSSGMEAGLVDLPSLSAFD